MADRGLSAEYSRIIRVNVGQTEEMSEKESISYLYPNPAKDVLFIKPKPGVNVRDFQLLDFRGSSILKGRCDEKNGIAVSAYRNIAGVLKVFYTNGRVSVHRLETGREHNTKKHRPAGLCFLSYRVLFI